MYEPTEQDLDTTAKVLVYLRDTLLDLEKEEGRDYVADGDDSLLLQLVVQKHLITKTWLAEQGIDMDDPQGKAITLIASLAEGYSAVSWCTNPLDK